MFSPPSTQPAWMRRLVVGSVIAERSGSWRVVRVVHRHKGPDGDIWGVTLAIKRCSWTRRCYTVITAADMKTRGFRLIHVKPRRLTSAIDKRIAASIADHHRRPFPATCCDIEAVA